MKTAMKTANCSTKYATKPATKPATGHAMGTNKKVAYQCVGFVFVNRPQFIDPEDYLDFLHREWNGEDAVRELEMGIMPPGMLIKAVDGNQVGVVVGPYNEPQEIRLLNELFMGETKEKHNGTFNNSQT